MYFWYRTSTAPRVEGTGGRAAGRLVGAAGGIFGAGAGSDGHLPNQAARDLPLSKTLTRAQPEKPT